MNGTIWKIFGMKIDTDNKTKRLDRLGRGTLLKQYLLSQNPKNRFIRTDRQTGDGHG